MVISRTSNSSLDGGSDPAHQANHESLSILSNAALNEQMSKGSEKLKGIERASTVLAGGLADGMINGLSNAAEHKWDTTKKAAESFAAGYGLSALSKAGRFGTPVATAAGLTMGGIWVYSELKAGRPQAALGAIDDAYHSGAHLEANRKQFAASGGAMAFDATLAVVAGGSGFLTAAKMHPMHVEGLNFAKASYGKTLDFMSRNPEDFAVNRKFAGKDSLGPWETIKNLNSDKPKGISNLADIQAHLERQRLSDDHQIIDIQERMRAASRENTDLALAETAEGTKYSRLNAEKQSIASLTNETEAVTRAQRDLTHTQELARSVPGKEREVANLAKEAETAQRAVRQEVDETGAPTSEKLAADEKAAARKKAQDELAALKEMANPEAVGRARAKLQTAESNLEAARAKQPELLAAKEAELEASRVESARLAAARAELNSHATTLIKAHTERMSAMVADPTLYVKGQRPEPAVVVRANEVAAPKAGKVEVVKETAPSTPAVDAAAMAKRFDQQIVADKPAPIEAKVEKASALSPELTSARERAATAVRENEMLRQIQTHQQTLREIDEGTYRPTQGRSVEEVRQQATTNIEAIQAKLGTSNPASYTRAIKSVGEYAREVARELGRINDSGERGRFAVTAADTLEAMMNRLPNSYKGFKGELGDISPVRSSTSPELRISEIQNHLEAKAKMLDGSRNRQLQDASENHPVLSEILRRSRAGELPEDGTIVLFGKDGTFLNPANSRSPHFIEVRRLNEHGVGADGAGFNRFIQQGDNIVGGAVLRPIYDAAGQPITVGAKSAAGRPVYKKEIVDLFGDLPQFTTDRIAIGNNFVKILEALKPGSNKEALEAK